MNETVNEHRGHPLRAEAINNCPYYIRVIVYLVMLFQLYEAPIVRF